MHWKRSSDELSRVHVLFSEPADRRGSAFLLVEQDDRTDMFVYLPKLQRVRRVTGRMMAGSFLGSDFSYEQFERTVGLSKDTGVERSPDAEYRGRAVYVIVHHPEATEGDFEKVVTSIDQETCVALKVDYFKADRVRRVLEADPQFLSQEGERWYAKKLVMRDLRRGSETRLVIDEIELDIEIPRSVFTERHLEQGH